MCFEEINKWLISPSLVDLFLNKTQMFKFKNLALLLAFSIFSIGVYIFFKLDSGTTELANRPVLPQLNQQPNSEPTAEVQPAPTGQDPFKKFLDEKPNNPSSLVKPENAKATPTQAGKDPFKEFLDKQKQNSKDQVVSPFGKN